LSERHNKIYSNYGPDEVVLIAGHWLNDDSKSMSVMILSEKDLGDKSRDSLLQSTFSPEKAMHLYAPIVYDEEGIMTSDDLACLDGYGVGDGDDSFSSGDPHNAHHKHGDERSHGEVLEAHDRIFERVTYEQNYGSAHADRSWLEGGNGVTLFHAESDTVSIGIQGGEMLSNDISINMSRDSWFGSFEIIDWSNFKSYQPSYTSSFTPGIFSYTHQLTMVLRYCIVTCLAILGTNHQLRTKSSPWSLGSVDINEHYSEPIVVVTVAEPSACSEEGFEWQASIARVMALSIKNDYDLSAASHNSVVIATMYQPPIVVSAPPADV
jgi:hypothetical protein